MTITTHTISLRSLLSITVIILTSYMALSQDKKITGMSFMGPSTPVLELDMLNSVDSINAEWIAAIPEATMDRSSLQLLSDETNDNWSETQEGITQIIRLAKASGKQVMLKPQVVLSARTIQNDKLNEIASYFGLQYQPLADKTYGAIWRGDFAAGNEKDWTQWEKNYEQYIIRYAHLAQSLDVDLFCVGTELREFAIRRPQFWKTLIAKVRSIYAGPLTYSANWDEYDQIVFWKELDFIGCNSYYPINTQETPEIKDIFKSWRKIRKQIRSISQKYNRKVLITEFGYRNVSFAGLQPWIHDDGTAKPNDMAQANLYEAFFKALWNESWIAGGFGWNWMYQVLDKNNTDFSVQGKPAMEIIAKYYNQ